MCYNRNELRWEEEKGNDNKVETSINNDKECEPSKNATEEVNLLNRKSKRDKDDNEDIDKDKK